MTQQQGGIHESTIITGEFNIALSETNRWSRQEIGKDVFGLTNSINLDIMDIYRLLLGFPGSASGKEPTCQCRRRKRCGFGPQVGKIPWRLAWQPTPIFLPEKSHEQRSLAGYSPWGRKESDTTK